ncbi:alpha/beta hydrolase [Gemmata sp.]|uniref:alpha/beta hydrolase n=1 Tax=Gemmata sp. TaxID=1914242 RepID=UPI003F726B0F
MRQFPAAGRRKRRCVWLAALVALSVAGWLLVSYAAVYHLTRRARPPYPEPAPDIAWGRVAPVRLATADGQELGAWFIDGRADRPLVVLLHGNGGSRSARLAEAELAARAGSPVLMVSQRAHGDSTGAVNDFGFSGRFDVVAAVEWLRARHPGRPVVVWGRSLGSAAALFAAAALGDRVTGYVLECPYQDLRTATRNRTRNYLPPILEFVAYAGLTAVAPLVLPDADAISPLGAARRVPPSARVLVLAGSADRRATLAEAAAITGAIGARAELVAIAGGDHLRLADADPERYRAAVLAHLEACGRPAE